MSTFAATHSKGVADERAALRNLSVIIPAYNEEQGIGQTLLDLTGQAPEAEIIVVNDGSTDATARIASRFPNVRLVNHIRNRGYGASLKTGLRSATRECVAWYDADGQHRPIDLIAVAGPVLEDQVDLTIGMRGPDSARQRERVVGKWVLAILARIISGERIPDINSGLRCFRREVLTRYLHLLPDGFSASTTSTLLMLKRGYRVGYVPILVRQRLGKSTVKIVSDGLRTLQLVVRIVVLFEAFRVFTALGALLFVPGLLYGLGMALTTLIQGQPRGFPTLAGTMVIAGLLTFFLGIIADQISELRKERFEEDVGRRAGGPLMTIDSTHTE